MYVPCNVWFGKTHRFLFPIWDTNSNVLTERPPPIWPSGTRAEPSMLNKADPKSRHVKASALDVICIVKTSCQPMRQNRRFCGSDASEYRCYYIKNVL